MIARDGKNISLWQDAANPYTTNNKNANSSLTYDVAIVGGGITGITTALLLQKAGLQCIILEANSLCFGTSGGTTAHLNTLLDSTYPEITKKFSKDDAKLVASAVTEAIDIIKSHISTYNIDCGYADADAFLIAQEKDQEDDLSDILEGLHQVGLAATEVEETSYKTIPFTQAIRVAHQGKFIPISYIFALAKEFEKAGGFIMQHCLVQDANQDEIITLNTGLGTFKARNLIYATHIPPGINLLHLRCTAYRTYVIAFSVSDEDYPEELLYDLVDPYHYYRSQEIDGKKYIIAGGFDHKTGQDPNAANCFQKLIAHCMKYFKIDEIAFRWSSQYFESSDGLPYIGHLPGSAGNIFVASGFGGNGMVYSQVAALTLKAIIQGEASPYIKLFDPNRIKPLAGFANFLSHNVDVVKQFVGKWFHREKLHTFSELAKGEGKIVDYEGSRLGLFRDEQGSLHALNPTCTHMKCQVQWNNTENSWDCPCHGARYDKEGNILNGPASQPLEKIELRDIAK